MEAQFLEIATHEAARDRLLVGALEWLILGATDQVSEEVLEDTDYGTLLVDIARQYQIDHVGALRALEICEQEIEERLRHGEA